MFKFKMPITYSYDDVTLIPSYSELNSRSDANTEMHGYYMPIMASCMDTLGTVGMLNHCVSNRIPYVAHRTFKNANQQFNHFFDGGCDTYLKKYSKQQRECVWFAVGSVSKYKDWIDYLYDNGVRRFCVDMAHGDSKACVDTIKYIKCMNETKKYEARKNKNNVVNANVNNDFNVHVIAGNVATLSGFRRLQRAGADAVRVGVASGSICSTCLETGFGVPILTNLMEIAPYKKNTWIIADGGVKTTGDIAKAVYFGADFCMIGKMFASTDLASGDCFNKYQERLLNVDNLNCNAAKFACVYPHEFEEKYELASKIDYEQQNADNKYKEMCKRNVVAYKEYHGMASREARKNVLSYASVQGVSGLIKYTSTTEQFIRDTHLRLQASLSYGGSRNWTEFRKKVKSCMRSNSGIIAADTHLQYTMDK